MEPLRQSKRLSKRSSRFSANQPLADLLTNVGEVNAKIGIDRAENVRWDHRIARDSYKASMVSLPSSTSVTTAVESSLYSDSSGSTIHGPGELSGRVIKALGNLAVLRIDNMLIKRRLAAYRTMFPHGKHIDLERDDGEEMYSEILEFTRCVFI